MILVDTSVLIEYFRGGNIPAVQQFSHVLDQDIPFGITPWIYCEVLQGCRSDKDFQVLKAYLETQVFYDVKDVLESYAQTAVMFRRLRRKGITVSSSIDCLVARIAIENDLFLLHNDPDYDRIAGLFPLKIWKI